MIRFIRPTSGTWAVVLLAAGLASNLLLSCGANLVAFAVLAALTLPLRAALVVALGVWIESQILGFTVFAYPLAAMTIAWGVAMGVATCATTIVAARVTRQARVAAFATGFVAYEAVLVAFALASRAGLAGFSAAIEGQIFASNAFVALAGGALFAATGTIEARIARARRARLRA